MIIQNQIEEYIASQSESKSRDMQALHQLTTELIPECRLWFLDGRNSEGKVVSNPNIGYGHHTITYTDGSTKEFYQIGMSANTTGISLYILDIDDKTYLSRIYGEKIGKAKITGYCIKFKALKDINIEVLKTALQAGCKQ
ncbi:DUF1801 domain-containing protein [Chryseobacterium arthrosphaerae]|uniref:DUF1801 domain-containing protein n=1 Tax=Chryseobacterium arthrosphaerae TaxID=651561 RepID=UPI001BAEDC96|nr:DUF1801 domain-containing protein [Chryseobacterium arthrosphaerae]QUY54614.1 DUF1801 domain-containing protein [Chryseobacterium arthrosphaerae]